MLSVSPHLVTRKTVSPPLKNRLMNRPTVLPNEYTVAVDIDGVLYELVEVMRQRIHRVLGRPLHTLPDPDTYEMESAWQLPVGFVHEQLIQGVKAGDVFWQGEPHQPGLDGLRVLKQSGYRVVLVSARDLPGVEDLCLEATAHWLGTVGAVYDDLILTSNKTQVPYHFLIDDFEHNVRAAQTAGRGGVLLNRGWNVNVELPQAAWECIPMLVSAHQRGLSRAA